MSSFLGDINYYSPVGAEMQASPTSRSIPWETTIDTGAPDTYQSPLLGAAGALTKGKHETGSHRSLVPESFPAGL